MGERATPMAAVLRQGGTPSTDQRRLSTGLRLARLLPEPGNPRCPWPLSQQDPVQEGCERCSFDIDNMHCSPPRRGENPFGSSIQQRKLLLRRQCLRSVSDIFHPEDRDDGAMYSCWETCRAGGRLAQAISGVEKSATPQPWREKRDAAPLRPQTRVIGDQRSSSSAMNSMPALTTLIASSTSAASRGA
jgi:hypothetical protein